MGFKRPFIIDLGTIADTFVSIYINSGIFFIFQKFNRHLTQQADYISYKISVGEIVSLHSEFFHLGFLREVR